MLPAAARLADRERERVEAHEEVAHAEDHLADPDADLVLEVVPETGQHLPAARAPEDVRRKSGFSVDFELLDSDSERG